MAECFPELYNFFCCAGCRIEGKELAQVVCPIFKQKIIFFRSRGIVSHHPVSKASNDSIILSEVLVCLLFIFIWFLHPEHLESELSNLYSDRGSQPGQ